MARAAVIVLAIAILLAVGSCGEGAEDPAPRTTGRDLRDLERQTIDKATRAQIEQFARVEIPASASELRSFSRDAMDTQLLVSFRVPREELDAFLRSGHFRANLAEGDRAIASTAGSELGWRLDEAKHVKGLSDVSAGRGRNLVVVLDDPQRPVVHLEVATL